MIKQLGKRIVLQTLNTAGNLGVKIPVAHLLKMLSIRFEPVQAWAHPYISPYKDGYRAASCISIDFEHLLDSPGRNSLNSRGTKAVLELAEQFSIPLTWAICGEAVSGDHEAYEQILASKVKHDIGVHTYSHLDLADPGLTDKDVENDIIKCVSLLQRNGQRSVSFVFPRNREGHFESLRHLGFIAYRSKERVLGYPRKRNGLWCIPPVYYIDEHSGDFETAKKLIDLALMHGCVFHLWFHPRCIAMSGDPAVYVKRVLKPIFQYIDERRREGVLWPCTMRDLANYCEARSSCTAIRSRRGDRIYLDLKCDVNDLRFDHPPEVTVRLPLPEGGAVIRVDNDLYPKAKVSASNRDLCMHVTLSFEEQNHRIEVTPLLAGIAQ